MIDSLRLYLRYISISIQSQMQYRTSFAIHSLAHFLITGTEFLGIIALFDRFGQIKGWTLPEMGFFYGLISIAFALGESIPRGFDIFGRLIRTGEFDRVLLRPRGTVLQIMGQELQLMRVGRFTQALIILLWSASALNLHWSAAKVMLALAAILGGACLFSGLFILQATICFWTIESIEIVNVATYGGVECAQFPLSIYRPWFRRIFTFVIPLACINYFPAHAILGRADITGSTALMQWLSPLLGIVFLFITLQIWEIGVRHYCSTGN